MAVIEWLSYDVDNVKSITNRKKVNYEAKLSYERNKQQTASRKANKSTP